MAPASAPTRTGCQGLRSWLSATIHESFVESVLGSVGIHEVHDSTGSSRAGQVVEEAGRWEAPLEDLYEPRPVPSDEQPTVSAQRKAEEDAAWRLKQEEDAALASEPEEEPVPKRPGADGPAARAGADRVAVQAVLDDHDILPDTAYASSRIAKWAWTEQGHQISSADVGAVLRSLGWQQRDGPGATAYYSPRKPRQ